MDIRAHKPYHIYSLSGEEAILKAEEISESLYYVLIAKGGRSFTRIVINDARFIDIDLNLGGLAIKDEHNYPIDCKFVGGWFYLKNSIGIVRLAKFDGKNIEHMGIEYDQSVRCLTANGQGGLVTTPIPSSDYFINGHMIPTNLAHPMRFANGYELYDDTVFLGDTPIMSNVIDIAYIQMEEAKFITISNDETRPTLKSSVLNFFGNAPESWKNAYVSFVDANPFNGCQWAGVSDTKAVTHMNRFGCMKHLPIKTKAKPKASAFAVTNDGKIYRLDGTEAIEQIVVSRDGDGFNQMIASDENKEFVFFNSPNGNHTGAGFILGNKLSGKALRY